MQQEHQVLLAARLEEGYHFLILLDSSHNFTLVQGPAAVLVDQLEALARGVFEVERELLDFFLRRLGLHLALGRAVRELVRQRDLDGLLPALLWTGEPRNASTLSRPRRRRTSTPPARHRRVEGIAKFQAPKRTTRPRRCGRRDPCPSAGAPTRGAPARAGTGGSGCRS